MEKILNLSTAAKRARSAIANKENIVLISDADLDGTASLLILEETIKSLGGNVVLSYFPDREKQGYGLTESVLESVKKYAPALLIMSDVGIANFKEIVMAKKIGFDVIVIDHHEILNNKVPEAIVVDPKQAGDSYSFKLMAACGLCFRFAEELLGSKMSENMRNSFLELAALGTIADMMPEIEDNKMIIAKGLKSLHTSLRPGIKTFVELFDGFNLPQRKLATKIISIIQLCDFCAGLTESYCLLSSKDLDSAKEIAKQMMEKNKKRRDFLRKLTEEIAEESLPNLSFVFKSNENIPHLLTGSIASRLSNRFKQPSFIIAQRHEISRGSARSQRDKSCLDALIACKDILYTYGGHPQAAGFSVENKNIEKFKQCLDNFFNQ